VHKFNITQKLAWLNPREHGSIIAHFGRNKHYGQKALRSLVPIRFAGLLFLVIYCEIVPGIMEFTLIKFYDVL
jgi:hypothetical protein